MTSAPNEYAPSNLSPMAARVDALYTYDDRGRMVAVNQWDGGIAPRFHLCRTSDGSLWRFRTDVADELAVALQALAHAEPCSASLAPLPHFADEYIRLLAAHAPVSRTAAGPVYAFPEQTKPDPRTGEIIDELTVAIDPHNADLLRTGLDEWLPDVPHRQPFVAVVEDGRAVALCASVRITPAAHEAGVETLPAYRQRGYATQAVAGWAAAVQALGAAPFYSTAWENIASQGVARRLGLELAGADFSVA